jgi:hypothetical protein
MTTVDGEGKSGESRPSGLESPSGEERLPVRV